MTYRLGGHSTSDDPRAYRTTEEVEPWNKADPLIRLRRHLEHLGAWSDKEEARFAARTEAEIKQAVDRAEQKPAPELRSMFDDVYAERPWHLEEQHAQCIAGPRPDHGEKE